MPLEERQLFHLLHAGVNTFIDLRHEAEFGADGVYKSRAEDMSMQIHGTKPTFASVPVPAHLADGELADLATADDAELAALVLDIIAYAAQGRKVYIHCTSGFQRTATVGALILGLVHGIAGAHALLMYQAIHDARMHLLGDDTKGLPAFASKRWPLPSSRELAHTSSKRQMAEAVQSKADSLGCPVFFPSQRGQVMRLLNSAKVTGPSEQQLIAKRAADGKLQGHSCAVM